MSDAPSPAPAEAPVEPKAKKKKRTQRRPATPAERARAKPRWMLVFGIFPWALWRLLATSPPAVPLHDGFARPNFARAFPRHPELDRLLAAFEVGDYLTVRNGAAALAREADDEDVRSAARELGRRIDPDPMSRWMMAGAGALLFFLACWYWTHAHVNGGP